MLPALTIEIDCTTPLLRTVSGQALTLPSPAQQLAFINNKAKDFDAFARSKAVTDFRNDILFTVFCCMAGKTINLLQFGLSHSITENWPLDGIFAALLLLPKAVEGSSQQKAYFTASKIIAVLAATLMAIPVCTMSKPLPTMPPRRAAFSYKVKSTASAVNLRQSLKVIPLSLLPV